MDLDDTADAQFYGCKVLPGDGVHVVLLQWWDVRKHLDTGIGCGYGRLQSLWRKTVKETRVVKDLGKKIVLGLVAVACLVGAHAALVASVVG
ncbi:hypothetical protein TDMWS_21400 [Thermodesulfomicrobium sp. WS]|nr:hypothetical protein TDMWS_21400 [Thermodesulfomicrobium sp. WS]